MQGESGVDAVHWSICEDDNVHPLLSEPESNPKKMKLAWPQTSVPFQKLGQL